MSRTSIKSTRVDFDLARSIRELRGLTRPDVAAAIDVPLGTYENWEIKNVQPKLTAETVRKLQRLEKVLGLSPGDLVALRPQDCPWCRLNGDQIRAVRLGFALTPTEVVEAVGLIDEAIYASWEAGELHPYGLAFQHRILEAYSEWSGATLESLFAPGPARAAPLPPLLAQPIARVEPFIGRHALLSRCGQWLSSAASGPRVLGLRAPSGNGKTALLGRVLNGLVDAAQPYGILYWNFSANPRSEEFLEGALAYFAGGTRDGSNPSLDRLEDWLAKRDPRPHVLVLDGLEALQDATAAGAALGRITDPSVRRLLIDIGAGLGATRALVASRLPFSDLAGRSRFETIELPEFSRDEALELLNHLGVSDATTAARLIELFGTHPLSLRLAPELALGGAGASAGLSGDAADGPRLDLALRLERQGLSALEHDLMRVLASLPRDASLATLLDLATALRRIAGALAGATPGQIGDGLRRLQARGLVSSNDGVRYRLHASIAAWWRETPPEREDAESPGGALRTATPPDSAAQAAGTWRWQLALLSLARGRAQARRLLGALRYLFAGSADQDEPPRGPTPGTLDELRKVLEAFDLVPGNPEGPIDLWQSPLRTGGAPAPGLDQTKLRRLIGLFESAVETGHPDLAFAIYQEFLGGYAELGHRRGLMVLGERLLRALAGSGDQRDQVALPPVLAPAQRFRVACDWGLFRGARGGLDGEIACYQAALGQTADAPLGEVVARRALAYAERQRGRLGSALIACDLALDAAGAAGLDEQRACCAALRASLLHDLGRVTEATEGFGTLSTTLARRRLVALGGIWQTERECDLGRVEHCLDLGRGVLGDCEALHDEGLVARCHLMLGRSLVRRDPASARRHLQRAQPWIDRTEHTELRLRAQELKSWIEGVRAEWRGAFFEAFKGLRLAEDCGYGLLRLRLAVLLVRWALPNQTPAILTRACQLLTAALDLGCPEYAWGRADALHWRGCAWAQLGDARARACLEEALSLREALGHPEADETRRALAQAGRGAGTADA